MNKHLSLGMPAPMQARLQSGELRKALEELLGPQARPATTGRGGGPLPGAHRSRPCCSRCSWLSSGGGAVKRVNSVVLTFKIAVIFARFQCYDVARSGIDLGSFFLLFASYKNNCRVCIYYVNLQKL